MRLAILLSLFLGTQAADAQWGIRFLTPHGENVTKLGLFRQLGIGIGIDHNVSGRTAIGFDYVLSFRKLMPEEYQNNPAIFPSEEVLARCELATYLGEEATRVRDEAWTRIQAA